MTAECSIEDCSKPIRTRGWCDTHYVRWWRTGTTELRPRLTMAERFWSKVDTSGDCWLWTAGTNRDGYGKFSVRRGFEISPHRLAYILTHGEIPDGLQIDHVCHNAAECSENRDCPHRRCVNPAHLEAVTGRENKLRSPNTLQGRSSCVNGHPYDEANTHHAPSGKRVCRACRRASNRRWQDRREQAAS